MKPFILTSLLLISIGCQESEPTPELPDYETALTFDCKNNTSEYFAKGSLRGQQLCYSTNDALYSNFAYALTGTITSSDTVNYNPGDNGSKIMALFGVGGLGGQTALRAPMYFYITTPTYSVSSRQYFLDNLSEGAELDILSTEETAQNLDAIESIFSVGLSAIYPSDMGNSAVKFQTWSGPQDPATAYLKVLEFEELEDGSFDITLSFRCKLYNNGRFYAEVTDGMMRTNVK